MRVKRLKMTSFRGIDDLTLEFDDTEPTVLIGINGAGKSSILYCLALFLSRLMMSVRSPVGFKPPAFEEQDITNGRNETRIETIISVDGLGDMPLTIVVARAGIGYEPQTKSNELETFHDFIHEQFQANSKTSLPLAVYYPTDRTVSDIPLENPNEYPLVQIAAYDRAIAGGRTDFTDFFLWFRKREDLENELRLNDNLDYRDRLLEAVRQAITSLLPDFSNLRVRRAPLRMTVTKQSKELIINQLSDGEKCLLAMVGDLARRLAIANPGLSDPLQGSGVVLIDEIELHLHPRWQRRIIPTLKTTFPNCQFIVTTHSPQVIGDVKPEGIYLLEATSEGIVARHPESSFGRDSNYILEVLMGEPRRKQEIKDRLLELFRLIDKGDLDSARQLRQYLAEEIGDSEPEFVRADVLIRRKEILNR